MKPITLKQRLTSQKLKLKELAKAGKLPPVTRTWSQGSLVALQEALSGGAATAKQEADNRKPVKCAPANKAAKTNVPAANSKTLAVAV